MRAARGGTYLLGQGGAPGAYPEAEAVLGLERTVAFTMPSPGDHAVVESLVSAGRFRPYPDACGGDVEQARRLYEWSVRLSGACFEAFHYVEVVIRNSVDREMRRYQDEEVRGIPWFLLSGEGKDAARFEGSITEVRRRLRHQGGRRETRDQIIAGLSFGFWSALLHSGYDELWARSTRPSPALPGSGPTSWQPWKRCTAFATGSPTTTPCSRWTSPSG